MKKLFADKRVSFTISVSSFFVDIMSKETLDSLLKRHVDVAAMRFLDKHPEYVALSDPMFVVKAHPTKEIDGKIVVDTELWNYIFDFELIKIVETAEQSRTEQ